MEQIGHEIIQKEGESGSTYRKRKWRAIRRTVNAEGAIVSKVQVRRSTIERARPKHPQLARVSTLFDGEGQIKAQWQIEKPEDRQRAALWDEIAAGLKEEIKPYPLIESLGGLTTGDFDHYHLACYPVGDHHLGMLSWKPETGASYDIEIGERLLSNAFNYLVPLAPRCERALIVFLGDFQHYDTIVPETQRSKHTLDADSRFPKMVRASIRLMRRAIDTVLLWHNLVHVIIEPGNHDPFSTVFLMETISAVYEGNPRVTIDLSPRHVHYFHWHKNLIGVHHGDKIKAAQLPGIMAHDQPTAWGLSDHRTWWTGHVHHHSADDYPGCTVESFRILPPPDAYAAHEGYRSHRDMKSILLHRDHGEVTRFTVKPEMLA